MSAYLRFFELEQSPFDTRSQSNLVLGTKALRDAYAQIQEGIDDGSPRICVSGGTGLGKTSLARALPKLLRDEARVVVLLNPSLPWQTLRTAIVKQLDLEGGELSRRALQKAGAGGRRLVLVIDAAERIARESLEHLDILLAYQGDDDNQLVHCVMLANLEQAAQQGDCALLWWLDSLHTLQLEFAPIPASGVETYIAKHLRRAGWKGGQLFTREAAHAVHRLTGGVPRRVSELCEAALEIAADLEVQLIEPALVEEVAGEPGAGRDGTDVTEPLALISDPYEATGAGQDQSRASEDASYGAGDAPDSNEAASPQDSFDAEPESRPATALDAYFGSAPPEPDPPPILPAAPAPEEAMPSSSAPPGVAFDPWPGSGELTRDELLRRKRIRVAIASSAALVLAIVLGWIGTTVFSSESPEPMPMQATRRPQPPPATVTRTDGESPTANRPAASPDADIQRALSAAEDRANEAGTVQASFEELAAMERPAYQEDAWAEAIRESVTSDRPPTVFVAPATSTPRVAAVVRPPIGRPSSLERQAPSAAKARTASTRTSPSPPTPEPMPPAAAAPAAPDTHLEAADDEYW